MHFSEKKFEFESFHELDANDDPAVGMVTRIETKFKEGKRLVWSHDVGWEKARTPNLHSGADPIPLKVSRHINSGAMVYCIGKEKSDRKDTLKLRRTEDEGKNATVAIFHRKAGVHIREKERRNPVAFKLPSDDATCIFVRVVVC